MSGSRHEVRFERFASGDPRTGGYGIARATGSEERLLAPGRPGTEALQLVDADACMPIPPGLNDRGALFLPRLALALAAWERLELEPGDAALVTSGSSDAAIYCMVARWRCARPPLYLDFPAAGAAPPAGSEAIACAVPQAAIEKLAGRLRTLPGAAAIVLVDSAIAVDILLEVMPPWGRIAIAVAATEPAAVDFYNHVHRNCTTLIGLPASPMNCFDPLQRAAISPCLRRAGNLLGHPAIAESCLRLA